MTKSLLLAVCLMALALPAMADRHITETPLVVEVRDQKNPIVFEPRVVFEDYRADGVYSDLYLYDFRTATVAPYATGSRDQWFPEMWGDLIVWMDNRTGVPGSPSKSDIFYSTQIGQQTNLTNDSLDQYWPSASRGFVFWEEGLSLTRWNIMGANLAAPGRFTIAAPSTEAHEVAAAYPWVVWKVLVPATQYDLYAKNLMTGQEILISNAANDQQFPHTDGRYVVWEDWRNSATISDIYVHDLLTGVQTALCTNSAKQEFPRVWGNFAVWADWRAGRGDIYGYDLVTGQEFPICTAAGDQMNPSIHANRVVWQDKRSGNFDIYTATITRDYAATPDIAQAKMLPDGAEIVLSGRIVTANFGAEAYIEDPDRNSGIRITGAWEVSAGSVVTVQGVMGTRRGEREVRADLVTVTAGVQPLAPYEVRTGNIGGRGFHPNVPDVESVRGRLHNVGLLMSTCGLVTATGDGWFTVDDGCAVSDGEGNTGVRVLDSGGAPLGKFVRVTGIVSVHQTGGASYAAVRTRSSADVTVVDP